MTNSNNNNNDNTEIKNFNIDQKKLIDVLEWKMPQDKIQKIILLAHKYASYQINDNSTFNRPTFLKVVTLIFLILFFILWAVMPIKNLLTSSIGKNMNIEIAKIEAERNKITGDKFAYNVEIVENLNWQKSIIFYDNKWKKMLAKSDLINNKAYVVSTQKDKFKYPDSEKTILTTANSTLSEDIKEDVYWLLKNNFSVDDTYLEFKNIDFWVDEVVNVSN